MQQTRSSFRHIFEYDLPPSIEYEAIQGRVLPTLSDRFLSFTNPATSFLIQFYFIPGTVFQEEPHGILARSTATSGQQYSPVSSLVQSIPIRLNDGSVLQPIQGHNGPVMRCSGLASQPCVLATGFGYYQVFFRKGKVPRSRGRSRGSLVEISTPSTHASDYFDKLHVQTSLVRNIKARMMGITSCRLKLEIGASQRVANCSFVEGQGRQNFSRSCIHHHPARRDQTFLRNLHLHFSLALSSVARLLLFTD